MKKSVGYSLILSFWLVLASCEETATGEAFVVLNPAKTGIHFNNEIIESDTLNPVENLYVYNGGGVGIGDINNDGLPDIFFAGNSVSSELYLNQGNLVFSKITEESGVFTNKWCTGVSMVDINSDGWLDIYISVGHKDGGKKGENMLFVNKGNNKFEEMAEQYGLNDDGYTTQAVFFDYDKDGDLDVYLLTNSMDGNNNLHPIRRNSEATSTDRLYQNNGDLTFTNVSKDANITIEGYGLGVAIIDANNDGWPDVYCSNDFITNDLLWINQKNGTFKEAINQFITQTSQTGMGIDIADFNNDSYVDIVQVDMLPVSVRRQKSMIPPMNYNKRMLEERLGFMPQFIRNTLQLNTGLGYFNEIGRLSGIHQTDWSWSPLFFDMDNDGQKDLFISNGYGKDVTDLDFINYLNNPFGTPEKRKNKTYKKMLDLEEVLMPNFFFNNKGTLVFENISNYIKNNGATISNGASYSDLDLDGDLDLVVSNINSIATIYENKTENIKDSNSYLRIELKGPPKNSFGIGTKVTLYDKNRLQYLEQYPVRGYKSSVEPILHFGLHDNQTVDSLKVIWPDGNSQTLTEINVNQLLRLDYNHSIKPSLKETTEPVRLLTSVNQIFDPLVHNENEFNDFEVQPLLFQMSSRDGPDIVIGDLNGDEKEDVLLGSSYRDTTFLWFQNANGQFEKGSFIPGSWEYEDQGLILVDLDLDGDLDLYAGSGGNEFLKEQNKSYYQDRLFYNDGSGNFFISGNSLPSISSNTSSVSAADFDKDGDIDFFIGAKNIPHNYPLPDQSYILRNHNGKFEKFIPNDLDNIGLITDSIWTDFDSDGWLDLIVVGHWIPITIFKNVKGSLHRLRQSSKMDNCQGLWSSISSLDFDLDGDVDFIVGNYGLNGLLKADIQHPIKLLAGDFDHNGVVDPILGMFFKNGYHAFHSRDALKKQIPIIGKRYPSYKSFALTTFEDILTSQEKEKAVLYTANFLESAIIENLGMGKFDIKPLPIEAQFSSVLDIYVDDFNKDNFPDFLLVGNRNDNELVGGFMDGSPGYLMLGNGTNDFEPIPPILSGFLLPSLTRRIAVINIEETKVFLITTNDGKVSAYRQ